MDVTFDEGPRTVASDYTGSRGITGFLLRHGFAKTLAQAQMILLALAVIIFICAGLIGRANMKSEPIDPRKNFVPAIPSL